MTELITATLITGIFSVLVALIQKSRKENKEDHNLVYDSLQELKKDVKDIDNKIDGHITWHLDQ